jgi:hypothetical protein
VSSHSVLALPVPELDVFVRDRTQRYDASFVSADPEFGHAHVTLLGPWLPQPTSADLALVADVVEGEPAFAFELVEVRQFPNGVVYLAPAPDEPFRRLTKALAEAFPQTPPYAGEFPDPVPHLTVDHALTGATPSAIATELTLPVEARAELVQLQWWANHDCHVRQTWRLG